MDGEHALQPPREPENRRKNEPPQQFAEVVAGGGEQRVDFVADLAGQIVAIHAVALFQVADRGLNGRARRFNIRRMARVARLGIVRTTCTIDEPA